MIVEKDFNIVFENNCFVLNLLKNKKELKEDSTDKYKVGGYFILLENALKAAIRYRNNKKYSAGESALLLTKDLKSYMKCNQDFKILINSIYDPIYELKKKLIRYD